MRLIYIILLGFTLCVSPCFAFSSNPPDGTCGNPPTNVNCTYCHGDFAVNSGNGLLELQAPGNYAWGVTYNMTVSLSDPDQLRWGFELTVLTVGNEQAGTLIVTDPVHTRLSDNPSPMPDFVKHTSAGTYAGDSSGATWEFQWTAPDPGVGDVTFFVAGNAANRNNSPDGDYIYTITVQVAQGEAVPAGPFIPKNPLVLSNYPNPFNPITTLTFSLDQPGDVRLAIYDVMGRQVTSLLTGQLQRGTHRIELNAISWSSGTYFARLVTPWGGTVRMMNLVK